MVAINFQEWSLPGIGGTYISMIAVNPKTGITHQATRCFCQDWSIEQDRRDCKAEILRAMRKERPARR